MIYSLEKKNTTPHVIICIYYNMFRYALILKIPLQDLTTSLISLGIVCHLRQTEKSKAVPRMGLYIP